MCTELLIACGEPLPIPEWLPPGRSIYVCECPNSQDAVAIFSKPYLYAIGTRQTVDGCGFQGEDTEARRAREELAAFLDRVLELVSDLEMYVAWHDFGDSGVVPSLFDRIGPSDIRTWMSGFTPDTFFLVHRED